MRPNVPQLPWVLSADVLIREDAKMSPKAKEAAEKTLAASRASGHAKVVSSANQRAAHPEAGGAHRLAASAHREAAAEEAKKSVKAGLGGKSAAQRDHEAQASAHDRAAAEHEEKSGWDAWHEKMGDRK